MKNLLLLLSSIILNSCSPTIKGTAATSGSTPVRINDGITTKSILPGSVDTSLLSRLSADITEGTLKNVHSVLIYKDGALLYENYWNGKDEKHGRNLGLVEHGVNTLHDIRSISKSVVSACIGIAIQKGFIKSADEPLKTFFPELKDDKRGGITIKNLLTMTSGLSWLEIGNYKAFLNDETRMDLSFAPVRFILNRKMVSDPGSKWNYSGGNTQLLAAIIKKVSGKEIDEFAREHLFNPLQIRDAEWIKLTLKKVPAAASGLRLRSRDLLKLGILYLDNGKFNKARILDSIWVENSLSPQIQRPDLTYLNLENGGYGYQFWTYNFSWNKQRIAVAEAKGNGGQAIFICKQLNLVVVLTAGNYGQIVQNGLLYKILKDYILPSLK